MIRGTRRIRSISSSRGKIAPLSDIESGAFVLRGNVDVVSTYSDPTFLIAFSLPYPTISRIFSLSYNHISAIFLMSGRLFLDSLDFRNNSVSVNYIFYLINIHMLLYVYIHIECFIYIICQYSASAIFRFLV